MLLHDELRHPAAQPGIRGATVNENPIGHHRLTFEDDSPYVSDDDANLIAELSIIPFEHSWRRGIIMLSDFKAWHHHFTEFGPALMRPLSLELFDVAGEGYSAGHAVTGVRDRSPVSRRVLGSV